MQHILYQINQTKKTFKDIEQIDIMIQVGKTGHFNFLK